MNTVTIHSYNPVYKTAFHSINVEWINELFFVTAADEVILRNPEKIISEGGEIFFAQVENIPVGTCAMIKIDAKEFELAKMGVLNAYRGMKAGEKLMQAVLDFARNRKAEKITLETAAKLKPAIALYEKYGFKRITEEYKHPLFGRMIFKMELLL